MNPDRSRLTKMKAARALGPNPRRWDMPPKHPDCGKRRCHTHAQAVAYALHLTRRCGHPLRVYRCDQCSGWHVTKRTTWEEP